MGSYSNFNSNNNNSSNNSDNNFISSEYDIKKIPYSLDAEQSVLGAVLISPEIYEEIAETLSVDDFYLDNHREIYDSITNLYLKNRSLDLVTLLEDIVSKSSRSGSGDAIRNSTKEYLMRLSDNVPVIANIKEYAAIVKEKSLRRKLISISHEMIKMAHEDASNSDIIIDRAAQMIFALAQGRITQDFVHVRNILVDVFANVHNLQTDKEAARGLSSGFSGIDNVLVGMNPGNLILIGARPGMGKTAFALNIAINAAAKKKTVAFFQLEMAKEEIVSRLLASEAFVDGFKLKAGVLSVEDWTKITEAGSRISECDIYIDDTPSMTVTGMKAKLRRLKKLDLVVIDHLQLMQTDRANGNRVQEISEISRNLKIMAKELNVPVITCAQLSRGPESRDDKRPMLSDLRESGAIEQDADVVMFLYRDDYYKESVEKHNRAEIIFAKNRHGAIGKVEVGFEKKFTRFYDIDEVHKEQ
ncbi:MAG: replicative DNA helicase [Oscillospiraceae bacterium]|nr:replicative DNA helicase [Oscillospiraceae bacterium]